MSVASTSASEVDSEREFRARNAATAIIAHTQPTVPSPGPQRPPAHRIGGESGSNSVGSGSVAGPRAPTQPPVRSARVALYGGRMGIPVIVSDDVVYGTRRQGWMSPVRRLFCLLVTFDFLFVGILWSMTILMTGRDLKRAMEQQIFEYTIHDSMFDCVVR